MEEISWIFIKQRVISAWLCCSSEAAAIFPPSFLLGSLAAGWVTGGEEERKRMMPGAKFGRPPPSHLATRTEEEPRGLRRFGREGGTCFCWSQGGSSGFAGWVVGSSTQVGVPKREEEGLLGCPLELRLWYAALSSTSREKRSPPLVVSEEMRLRAAAAAIVATTSGGRWCEPCPSSFST